ncbi:MAG TPA: hypothetical protein VGK89_14465 [Candidatus Eisenbacteria bacterium]|jgi:hypothetical protein
MWSWLTPAGRAWFAVAVLTLVGVGAVLAFAPLPWSVGPLVGDDAGYYLAIARNYCLGYGLSFDRLHPTNGFNPLYPLVLIPLVRLLPPGLPIMACYRAGLLADFAAMVLALFWFLRLLDAFLARGELSAESRSHLRGAGVAFFALFVATKPHYGMDPPLVLLTGLWYLARVARRGLLAPGTRAAALDGCLLGLLFLARVDSLPFLVAAWVLMALETIARRNPWGPFVGRVAVTAALCAPYLLYSTARFGTWLPVSARIKSSFPHLDLAQSLRTIRGTSLGPADHVTFVVAYPLAWVTIALLAPRVARAVRARSPLEPWSAALGLMALYLVGRLSYMLLFSRADVQGGYFVLAPAFIVMAFVTALGALARRGQAAGLAGERRLAALGGSALALVAVLAFAAKLQLTLVRHQGRGAHGAPNDAQLGREIHDRTGRGDVIFGGSFGLAGFFSDRAWINGDGVANNYEYQRMFLAPGAHGEGGLEGYLRANHVTHVAFVLPSGMRPEGAAPIRLSAYSWLYDRLNEYEVWPRDIVLARPSGRGPPGSSTFYLARWTP